jgi:hypothetical protein
MSVSVSQYVLSSEVIVKVWGAGSLSVTVGVLWAVSGVLNEISDTMILAAFVCWKYNLHNN